ncbi:MAG TPA: carboxypeptidase-like regulatory domain-containing protein, partial [Cyclobacteriaceae bacterium]
MSFLVTFVPSNANDQQSSTVVTGFVYSEADAKGLPGVNVAVKGTSKGVFTDASGKFTIELLPSEDILVFSFVGFVTQEVRIGSQTTLDVKMEEEVSELKEVVVVGYGEQKKINLTGAVETAKFDGAVNVPVTNTAQLMYGKFSGVQITQSSGLPGSDNSSILIRGLGTFGASTPLVVIDNMQYETLREFNNLAPSDIESIT